MGSGRLLGEAFAHRGSNVFEGLSVDLIFLVRQNTNKIFGRYRMG